MLSFIYIERNKIKVVGSSDRDSEWTNYFHLQKVLTGHDQPHLELPQFWQIRQPSW